MVEAHHHQENTGAQLTKEETAIYDRQIRLWGVEAQQRLRKAKILVVGMCGLGNEVSKNILLAGVKHMTLLDHTHLEADEWRSQFLAPQDMIGKNKAEACLGRARELNPMVEIVADTADIDSKSDDFIKDFDVVCLAGCSGQTQVKVNEICRRLGVKFLSGNVFGYYGYMFADLGTHEYVEEKTKVMVHKAGEPPSKKKKKEEDQQVEMEHKSTTFCGLRDALDYPYLEGKTLRQVQQVSKTYLVMQVLHAYQEKYGSYPRQLNSNRTVEQLLDMRNDVLDKLRVDADLLPDDFTSACVSEMFPVNAIVGGVLAQEVIKAVSGKDAPHNNFFFYNGLDTSGVVLNVAPSPEKKNIVPSTEKKEGKRRSVEPVMVL